jgi:hypothetical protein
MLVTLDAPYVDTTAADLSFALGLAEQPALHVLDLPLPAVGSGAETGSRTSLRASSGLLRLRLLGASHQVVLRAGADELVETVACLPGQPPALPAAVDSGGGYRFTARVHRLTADAFTGQVTALRGRLTADPQALVGVFPGSRDALTALQARFDDDGRIHWATWHSYPQTTELVQTETVVQIP